MCIASSTHTHTHQPRPYKQTLAPQARKCYCKHPSGPLQLLYKESVCVIWRHSAAARGHGGRLDLIKPCRCSPLFRTGRTHFLITLPIFIWRPTSTRWATHHAQLNMLLINPRWNLLRWRYVRVSAEVQPGWEVVTQDTIVSLGSCKTGMGDPFLIVFKVRSYQSVTYCCFLKTADKHTSMHERVL